MENPATWNKCIKVLNNSLNYGHDKPLTVDRVLDVLTLNNLFIGEGLYHPMIKMEINKAIVSFNYEIENQCCGNSIGNKIYFNLKPLGVVE